MWINAEVFQEYSVLRHLVAGAWEMGNCHPKGPHTQTTHHVAEFSVGPILTSGNCYFKNPILGGSNYCRKSDSPAIWLLQVHFSALRCWKLQRACLRVKYIKQIFSLPSWCGNPLMQFLARHKTKWQRERAKLFLRGHRMRGFFLGVQHNGRRCLETSFLLAQTSRVLQLCLKRRLLTKVNGKS